MTNHKELVASLIKQDASLSRIYSSLSKDIARVLKKYKITNNSKLWFKNALVKKEMEAVLKKHQRILFSHISTNATQAWNLSNKQNDAFVNNYIKGITIPNQNFLFQRNTNALSAFLKRRDNGLNLSDRVWNITNQTQSQLEFFIAEGLTEGRSATNMAKDLQRYLKDENTRFRRIRDKTTGKLKISNPASGYHPGRGVYRSSYKNALRLARNETNIAFRASDFERRKQLPFVLGVTVHLSPAHLQFDICDDLQGDYPKQFKFTGWHPNCLCFTTAKLASKKDFINHLKGKGIPEGRFTNNIPNRASTYLNKNADRLKGFKNTPHFIRDNFKNTKNGFSLKSKTN